MRRLLFAATLFGVTLAAMPARSADTATDPKEIKSMVDKAAAYLKTRQNADGSIAPKVGGPGVSSLVAVGLIRHGRADDPVAVKALGYVEKNVRPDGGVYDKILANYTTSLALVAFKEANAGGKYDAVIANASKFLKGVQQAGDENDAAFGGAGYDAKSRPDGSNTQFFIEGLIAAGVPKTDPAIQRALAFMSKCQNLPGETNKLPYAKKATAEDKGGFVYTPLGADDPKNNKRTPEGGLRSEGGMTYAGLKSFLYAGVSKNDDRVKAAVDWVRRHYTLKENPGMGQSGLFYYYHTFAKAMDAYGEDRFADADGKKHDWRQELVAVLKEKQKADGSWVNENGAFGEGTPELCTAFALLALSYCLDKK